MFFFSNQDNTPAPAPVPQTSPKTTSNNEETSSVNGNTPANGPATLSPQPVGESTSTSGSTTEGSSAAPDMSGALRASVCGAVLVLASIVSM